MTLRLVSICGLHIMSAAGMVAFAQTTPPVGVGPEPSPIPISWELDFKFLDLRRLEVQLPGSPPETYWYLVYTVTNTSDRSQHFFPMFSIVTEDLKTIESDMGISPLVFQTIKERHKLTHPDLVHPTQAIGDLKSGEDNARESVAIWRQFDLKVNNISVFVAGLSGEKRFVRNPRYDGSKPEATVITGTDGKQVEHATNPKFFVLRKTLEIPYSLPGSPQTRELGEPQRGKIRWLMR